MDWACDQPLSPITPYGATTGCGLVEVLPIPLGNTLRDLFHDLFEICTRGKIHIHGCCGRSDEVTTDTTRLLAMGAWG